MTKHVSGIGIIQVGTPPIRITRHAQHIESKAASSRARENIDGLMDVSLPDLIGHVAFDIEYSARDREVGDFRRLRSYPPLTVIALTVKLPRFLDHAWRDVITNEAAMVAGGAKKAQEISEATAEIDDGGG